PERVVEVRRVLDELGLDVSAVCGDVPLAANNAEATQALLVTQPEIGQSALLGMIFMTQLFLYGYPLWIFVGLAFLGLLSLLGAYFLLGHVRNRIDLFLDPASGDNYQISKSVSAFANGGLSGKGIGEGEVKFKLPDGHSDFVFAVMGEEYGAIVCIIFIILFGILVIRPLVMTRRSQDLFRLLCVGGLAAQIGLQASVNMLSTVALIPSKGMTLPLISYGGSSLLAICLSLGIILALTRKPLVHANSKGAPEAW
ncbi:MAG: FtsW/RodA/SpoVE family cell cycle protein, partial [Pseudomonadota bacterium]